MKERSHQHAHSHPRHTPELALRQRVGLRTCIVGPDNVEYTLTAGPHAGRHAIQHFYYQRVAPGVETTVWYEESGALVHIPGIWNANDASFCRCSCLAG